MWYNKNTNERISGRSGLTVNEVQYSSDIFRWWSESELNAIGIYTLVETPMPTVTELQTAIEGPVDATGIPTTTWVVQDKFTDTPEYTDINGVVVPAKTKAEHESEYLARLQAEAMMSIVQHFTDVTTRYIQDKVDAYNVTHGVAFKDIDAFAKYAMIPTSIYKDVALQFITYSDSVWTAARAHQAAATTVPTDVQFKAVLDGVIL